MIMIMKTFGSQVDSPVAEGKRKGGGGRKIRDQLRKDKAQNIVRFDEGEEEESEVTQEA